VDIFSWWLLFPESYTDMKKFILPVLIAIYDSIANEFISSKSVEEDSMSNSLFDDIHDYFTHARFRYILPTTLLFIAGYMTAIAPVRSSYICPIVSNRAIHVHLIQYLGIVLDVVLIVGLSTLLSQTPNIRSRGNLFGGMLLLSAILLGIVGTTFLFFNPEHRAWASTLSPRYVSSAFTDVVLIALFLAIVNYIASEVKPLYLLVVIYFSCTIFERVRAAWTNLTAFPPQSGFGNFFTITLLLAAMALFLSTHNKSEQLRSLDRRPSIPVWYHLLMITILLYTTSLFLYRNNVVGFSPPDVFMYEANNHADKWLKQAASSENITAAVSNYRARYGRDPPPGFDKWYEFTISKGSVIIDDFDQINDDLLPFWALEPSDIRLMTDRILNNPWNGVGGISIRNGIVQSSPHIPRTHQWMVDGTVQMISKFSAWLPDMDVALNLHDECRVAVPYERMESMRKQGERATTIIDPGQDHGFSHVDVEGRPMPPWMDESASLSSSGPSADFEDRSFGQNFYDYGAATCPPSSPARRNMYWNKLDLCATCAYPHTTGQFLQNWTLSSDLCHQPDMADLHGFLLSPSVFKPSTSLLPVFSQSKVAGYSDILFPSPWDYEKKATYDVHNDKPFFRKTPDLFWRGSTSEGISFASTWRGMQRQRLVHLTNNRTTPSIPILLPVPTPPPPTTQDTADREDPITTPPKHKYQYVPTSDLNAALQFNTGFVNRTSHCGLGDCEAQAEEFGFQEEVDFQEHWEHKYLLDLDGAGFSGRFLPFLQSKSLPFRAGIFRTWYDERLTAWLHFVPVDPRLHGLHATLAYFEGISATLGGRDVKVASKQTEAEWIADKGRKWAEQVLRDVDMEVYMFRLLLEWGRLVDDRRAEIGFIA
jgi:hypothetical protein